MVIKKERESPKILASYNPSTLLQPVNKLVEKFRHAGLERSLVLGQGGQLRISHSLLRHGYTKTSVALL